MVAVHMVFIGMASIFALISLVVALAGETRWWWRFGIAITVIVSQVLALRERRRRE